MAKPVRLRLSRAKGFDLQAHSLATNGLPAVNVARPGPWGNPFVVGIDGDRAECVRLHRLVMGGFLVFTSKAVPSKQVEAENYARSHIVDLRGKNLACWCGLDGGPCHANTLLEIASSYRAEEVV